MSLSICNVYQNGRFNFGKMMTKLTKSGNSTKTSSPNYQLYAQLQYNLNETPTVRGLAADNNNKLYTETMIFLWNNHYNLNFIM